MSLITLVGCDTANSFVDLDEASTILAAAPFDTVAWDDESEAWQEGRLIMAAELMECLSWRGYKAYQYQALCFPRTVRTQSREVAGVGVILSETDTEYSGFRTGVTWSWVALGATDLTTIPTKIKEAQTYIAWLVISRGLTSLKGPASGVGGAPVKSVNLGGQLAVTFADTNFQDRSVLRNLIMNNEFPIAFKLAPFLTQIRGYSGDVPELQPRVEYETV